MKDAEPVKQTMVFERMVPWSPFARKFRCPKCEHQEVVKTDAEPPVCPRCSSA